MLKGKISITRPSYGDHRQKIAIGVTDSGSHIQFLELQIDLDDFTKAVTGQGMIPIEFEVRGLENVGRNYESEYFDFPLPKGTRYADKKAAIKELRKVTPEGWKSSEHFSSQDSFYSKDGVEWAHTYIFRWVDAPEDSK